MTMQTLWIALFFNPCFVSALLLLNVSWNMLEKDVSSLCLKKMESKQSQTLHSLNKKSCMQQLNLFHKVTFGKNSNHIWQRPHFSANSVWLIVACGLAKLCFHCNSTCTLQNASSSFSTLTHFQLTFLHASTLGKHLKENDMKYKHSADVISYLGQNW